MVSGITVGSNWKQVLEYLSMRFLFADIFGLRLMTCAPGYDCGIRMIKNLFFSAIAIQRKCKHESNMRLANSPASIYSIFSILIPAYSYNLFYTFIIRNCVPICRIQVHLL